MTQANANATANAQQVERPIPAWIGIAVVLICLSVGGAFLWWYLREPLPSAGEIIPDAGRTVSGGGRVARPRPPRIAQVSPDADGVRVSSSNGKTTYNVRADQGKSLMDVDKAGSGALSYVFRYQRKDLLTSDQRDLAMIRFRIMQDQAVAQALAVTPDQMQKLSAIPRAIQMELSDSDRQNLINLFGQYDSASGSNKSSAEKALTSALKQAGDRSFDATKAKIKERADQITAILTPDQIKKFNAMSNGN
jgi:Spy/CpxP family protein refolding chaperone